MSFVLSSGGTGSSGVGRCFVQQGSGIKSALVIRIKGITCLTIYYITFTPVGNHPTGGLVLGGGGFFIPILKYSPVSLRFQPIRRFKECSNLLAPGTGQSPTQQPQNQHSSGYSTMGGLPFSGLGTSTPDRHTFTHVLQPLHISSLNITGLLGVTMFGYIRTSSCVILLLLILQTAMGLVIFYHINMIIQGQFPIFTRSSSSLTVTHFCHSGGSTSE